MQEVVYGAKTKEDAIKKVSEALNASEKELIYSIEEEKGKLFKSVTYNIKATIFSELIKEITKFLENLIKNLGLNVIISSKVNDRKISIELDSDNNQILIGKNGQTLKSLEIITKQYILNKYNYYINISLDVENYKEKRIKRIERIAKQTAKEVKNTKIEAKLENMNSFERRIVHNALQDFEGITTISEGEDPNRHVIIKPIEK